MQLRGAGVVVVAACGRFAFDSVGDGGAGGGGGGGGDVLVTDGSGGYTERDPGLGVRCARP